MLQFRASTIKWFLLFAVFLAVFGRMAAQASSVQTYVDQAVPDTTGMDNGQPLAPGTLTMQDLLNSSAESKDAQKKRENALKHDATALKPSLIAPVANPLGLTPIPAPSAAPITAPKLQPVPPSNAPASLLSQGMQSVFGPSAQQPAASPLHAPQASADQLAAAPVNVAKGVSVAPLPDVASMPSNPITAPVASAQRGGCTPQTSSWTKSCAEAGYPDNYVGQIRGETRSTCPAGNLQDVWISNGCVPPEGSDTATATTLTHASGASSTPVDASCGTANGLATNARPLDDLCSAGSPTPIAGNGPWHWNCQGSGGGMTVSCAAPLTANAPLVTATANTQNSTPNGEDAQCGAANGVTVDNPPTSGLCNKGAASRVNGTGPWTWACSGTNGGRAVSCNAPKKIDGICGEANGSGSDQMPMAGLCAAGYASAVTGNGPWAWTCSGLNGGQAATCSAAPRMNAVCGPATLSGRGDMPKNALCSVGEPTPVTGGGPWEWACTGLNGGASVSCEARVKQDGVCGLSHGMSLSEAPTDNLCNSGQPSRVGGNGPWNWTCSGSDGGDTASCTAARNHEQPHVVAAASKPSSSVANDLTAPAPMASPVASVTSSGDSANLCGSAAELVAIEAPTRNLCKAGTASSVSGRGPWTWTCDDHKQQTACATLSLAGPTSTATPAPAPAPAESNAAMCGMASGQGMSEEPSNGLCTNGKASSVSGHGPWTWSCSKGKSHVSCQADKVADGSCGSANGSVQRSAPSSGLCNSGSATPIQGSGPWIWSCVGSGGGASISCSAASQAQTRVDGSCGSASNTSVAATPAANLCDSGVASAVYGQGPWTWTCSGLNGGVAASCSAMKNTPAAPPPPGPPVNGLCGTANGVAMAVEPMDNLCSTGTATSVSGNGPWNWNCIGENSGMTVSCTAPLQPPAPISGICGSSNGVPTLVAPKAGLCSGGISSAVSGRGPWTWSCSGVNGGSAVGCVAPLAGSNVGSLPSMTSTADAPVPLAAPTSPVVKRGLVTPRMATESLPPISSGNLPPPPKESMDMSAPTEVPQLPEDTAGVTPPPVRDYIQPAPGLKTDSEGTPVLPGNHFVLDADISTVPFAHGAENYDTSVAATLGKLADVLQKNGGVRITLTAYADVAGTTPRDARRLSLSRALAIRDYLTSKGISSARIDVRALGANVPSGDADRVDIKAN